MYGKWFGNYNLLRMCKEKSRKMMAEDITREHPHLESGTKKRPWEEFSSRDRWALLLCAILPCWDSLKGLVGSLTSSTLSSVAEFHKIWLCGSPAASRLVIARGPASGLPSQNFRAWCQQYEFLTSDSQLCHLRYLIHTTVREPLAYWMKLNILTNNIRLKS